jgi:hypothetical protein
MLQRVRAGTALAFIARKWTKILFSRRFRVLADALLLLLHYTIIIIIHTKKQLCLECKRQTTVFGTLSDSIDRSSSLSTSPLNIHCCLDKSIVKALPFHLMETKEK